MTKTGIYQKIFSSSYSKSRALKLLNLGELFELLQPRATYDKHARVLARLTPVCPGLTAGKLVFGKNTGKTAGRIVVTETLTQADFAALKRAAGLIVLKSSPVSPGILLAKSMDVPCAIADPPQTKIRARSGDSVVLNAYQGVLMGGKATITTSPLQNNLKQFISSLRFSSVPRVLSFSLEPKKIGELAALGIGLAIRGEDVLTLSQRALTLFRDILLGRQGKKQRALRQLAEDQKTHYEQLLAANGNLPCIIRLFDPPLSEFLPAAAEDNKMLGHRGCRIGVTNPEIYRAQLRAIFSAAASLQKQGLRCRLNISIPFVVDPEEVRIIKPLIAATKKQIEKKYLIRLDCRIGAAIETPRAAYLAQAIAQQVDYLGFGINDLTQLVTGISRTDNNRFLKTYINKRILTSNPFSRIDPAVLAMIEQASQAVRANSLNSFVAVHDYRDVAKIIKIFPRGLNIVCAPQQALIIKLAAAKSSLL